MIIFFILLGGLLSLGASSLAKSDAFTGIALLALIVTPGSLLLAVITGELAPLIEDGAKGFILAQICGVILFPCFAALGCLYSIPLGDKLQKNFGSPGRYTSWDSVMMGWSLMLLAAPAIILGLIMGIGGPIVASQGLMSSKTLKHIDYPGWLPIALIIVDAIAIPAIWAACVMPDKLRQRRWK